MPYPTGHSLLCWTVAMATVHLFSHVQLCLKSPPVARVMLILPTRLQEAGDAVIFGQILTRLENDYPLFLSGWILIGKQTQLVLWWSWLSRWRVELQTSSQECKATASQALLAGQEAELHSHDLLGKVPASWGQASQLPRCGYHRASGVQMPESVDTFQTHLYKFPICPINELPSIPWCLLCFQKNSNRSSPLVLSCASEVLLLWGWLQCWWFVFQMSN